jgi:hypothetical protein
MLKETENANERKCTQIETKIFRFYLRFLVLLILVAGMARLQD